MLEYQDSKKGEKMVKEIFVIRFSMKIDLDWI